MCLQGNTTSSFETEAHFVLECPLYSFIGRGLFLRFKIWSLGNLASFHRSNRRVVVTGCFVEAIPLRCCRELSSIFGSSLMRFGSRKLFDILEFENNSISFHFLFISQKKTIACVEHTSFLKPRNVKKRLVLCGYRKVVSSHTVFRDRDL